ncbi:phosphatidylethanolamine-binding protein [Mycena galopus ATCC 62051]|nr:phosphatidylethanolamine-binding protein [Mycena galopus ATCC 62051]
MPLIDPFSNTNAALTRAGLIPDVLGPLTPTALLTLLLPSSNKPIALGAEIPIADTVEAPGISIAAVPAEADIGADGLVSTEAREAKYTVAMFDPDAPSAAQPTSAQFRHWVITGLTPTDDPTAPALQPTPAANVYRPPGPWKGTGVHRYTFALFREPPNFVLPADAADRDPDVVARRHWDARVFAERYGLQMVGATFYLVRAED